MHKWCYWHFQKRLHLWTQVVVCRKFSFSNKMWRHLYPFCHVTQNCGSTRHILGVAFFLNILNIFWECLFLSVLNAQLQIQKKSSKCWKKYKVRLTLPSETPKMRSLWAPFKLPFPPSIPHQSHNSITFLVLLSV